MKPVLLTDEQYTWLMDFKKIHYINTTQGCIGKLIDNYKAWNEKLGKR